MRSTRLVAAAAFGAIALSACGAGGSYSSSSPSPKPVAATHAAPAGVPVKTGSTSLGQVLVDQSGRTLYGLTQDANGMPTCVGACADAWPPLTVNGASLPAGLDPKLFSVTSRPDGSYQLKAGSWPLYRFSGDSAAGDTNGQGSGGVWFVVTPGGTLHKS